MQVTCPTCNQIITVEADMKKLIDFLKKECLTRDTDFMQNASLWIEWIEDAEKKQVQSTPDVLNKTIWELGLSVRACGCLENSGVHHVHTLITKTDQDILRIRNCGQVTLREIKNALGGLNLHLAHEPVDAHSYMAPSDGFDSLPDLSAQHEQPEQPKPRPTALDKGVEVPEFVSQLRFGCIVKHCLSKRADLRTTDFIKLKPSELMVWSGANSSVLRSIQGTLRKRYGLSLAPETEQTVEPKPEEQPAVVAQ